jgi:hypothetical protein
MEKCCHLRDFPVSITRGLLKKYVKTEDTHPRFEAVEVGKFLKILTDYIHSTGCQ